MDIGSDVRIHTTDYYDGLCGKVEKVFLDLNGVPATFLVRIHDLDEEHDYPQLFNADELEYR